MAITYSVSSYEPTDTSVEVVYTDSETGFTHTRHVNIPRLQDGSGDINEDKV